MQHEKNTTPERKAYPLWFEFKWDMNECWFVKVRPGCDYKIKLGIWFLWTATRVCVSSFMQNNYINMVFSKALGGAQCTTLHFVLSGSQWIWINPSSYYKNSYLAVSDMSVNI